MSRRPPWLRAALLVAAGLAVLGGCAAGGRNGDSAGNNDRPAEYFRAADGAGEIERRLLYTEGLTTPDPAAPLLGTIVIDRAAAQAFFGDRYRLDRDLLSDGARKHLDSMVRGAISNPR